MKKLSQKITFLSLFIVLSTILTGVGFGFYYWQQLTQLPDWYQPPGDSSSTANSKNQGQLDPTALKKDQLTLRQKLQTQIQKQVPQATFPRDFPAVSSTASLLGLPVTLPNTQKAIALTLDNRDLQQVLLNDLAQNPQTQPLLSATQGFKTTITDQTVSIGTVINSQAILQSASSSQKQQKFQQFFQRFPQFKDRDLAIQLEGKPRLDQGKLFLDSNSTLSIGNIRFSIADLAQRLGISPEQVTQFLTIDSEGSLLKALHLKDNQLTLEIAPRPIERK